MAPSIHLDEGVSQNPAQSPGTLENDEYLIREMCDPNHFDENGNVTEAAISLKHLQSKGVSVHRRQYTPIDYVKTAVRNRCKDRDGWIESVSLFTVEAVRAKKDEGKQVFCVIDAPIEENPGHANIYFSHLVIDKITRPYARKLRHRLLPLLQNRMSVDAAYHAT